MISLLFCGDFAPVQDFERMVIQKNELIFGELLTEIKKADLSFINLEAPACNVNKPIIKSGPVLKINPHCLNSLYKASFDVVGMANNHILDHGESGFLETIESCAKYHLNYVGIGKDISEARKPLILERNGVKIGIIAVAEQEFCIASKSTPGAAPLDPIDNTYQIEKTKNDADFVFVTIHGGNEYFPFPRPGLRKICKYFINRGVDGVICHHPHVPGAYELYKGKPIVYSLGNIIFDTTNPLPGWYDGYAVRLDFNIKSKKMSSFNILPYRQSVNDDGVKLLHDNEKEIFIKKIDNYNLILDDQSEYKKEWDNFCNINKKNMLIFNFLPITPLIGIISKIVPIKQLFLSKGSISTKLNLIRCDSHLELLKSILEKIYHDYTD